MSQAQEEVTGDMNRLLERFGYIVMWHSGWSHLPKGHVMTAVTIGNGEYFPHPLVVVGASTWQEFKEQCEYLGSDTYNILSLYNFYRVVAE